MELQEESSRLGALPTTTSRNPSSSSSAFISACQSPFFSPRSPKTQKQPVVDNPVPCTRVALSGVSSDASNLRFTAANVSPLPSSCTSNFGAPKIQRQLSPSNSINGSSSDSSEAVFGKKQRRKKGTAGYKFSGSVFLSSTGRPRECDVYIGFHGRKPSLLRFTNWLRAELESQGISCYAADRAQCRNTRTQETVERAMSACTFGVVVLTKKSFGNPYSMEELMSFLGRKNLVPIFFDLGADDCIARDMVEMRGEPWEKHGGELWMLYGGLEKEWKETVDGLMRMDDWKLEARDGNWRDCILNAVILLATRLGRRSAVDRMNRWRERVEKEEFPFPRNENFVGRKKELTELELILFGDVCGDGEKELFELRPRPRRKNLVIRPRENGRADDDSGGRGKEPVIWKESEREIEMQNIDIPQRYFRHQRSGSNCRHSKKGRWTKSPYGKGVACVSGIAGIGKTELALEYAHRFCQRYKMVLWIGGESRYIRQNFLNLRYFVDVGVDNHCPRKGKAKCFERQEEEAIGRLRRELVRDIPFLVVIDNLESEKDWWDGKSVMELLPRFGGEAHFIITTRLPQVMNLEPMRLSFLSGVEAIALMKGGCCSTRDFPMAEVEALRVMEERLGRLTLGLGVVGAILSEIPITPTRLLDTVSRMPVKDSSWSEGDGFFLQQLLEVCFSIFDHADGPRSLSTRMVQASGWFAPSAIPVPLLAFAANRIPESHCHHYSRFWNNCLRLATCGFTASRIKKSEAEASSMLVRFGVARSSSMAECIHFHELVKLYARKRGTTKVAHAMVEAVGLRGSFSHHPEHLWSACFLLLGFGTDPVVVEPKPSELIFLVKNVVLPLAIHTFINFSRCNAALELLRLCTDAMDVTAESMLSRVEKWYDGTLCCGRPRRVDSRHTDLWQELALLKATVLETRTKLLLKGGQYDAGDDLIRKAIFIRTSICGEQHPHTVSARETLGRLTRLRTSIQS